MQKVRDYERQVYAAVLGKVFGVYMGRPFEGWTNQRIEERWGVIDRYVHEDQDVRLVVADDDISGTLTFVRALEDSGLYAETPTEFFGDTWLNYLIENLTVLWWGGMGHSTEHTAYLRLKSGIKAPRSGSIELNGKTVAEQIGAQIFIDALGMVAPGNPELAAELASRAGSVSHDGESVYGAMVVAALVAAAFVEKDMNRLLDTAIAQVPENCLIAKVHRDVRGWARQDNDWRKTYKRIDRKYGYHKYGGNCHIIPNHAVMVMAWVYAPDDFHLAQLIVNTAGWDTDCNAANVGSVMGLVVGLDRICEKYDFQSPTADRILLPTADGTNGVTDCLIEALRISRIGRTLMGWKAQEPPKKGAWHHFEMPGALHGYMAETEPFAVRGAAEVENVSGNSALGTRSLRIKFQAGPGRIARASTPVMPLADTSAYSLEATPRLYPGMQAVLKLLVGDIAGKTQARLFVRPSASTDGGDSPLIYGAAKGLTGGRSATLTIDIPDLEGWCVEDLGIEFTSSVRAAGTVFVDTVEMRGKPTLSWPDDLPARNHKPYGFITNADFSRPSFSDDKERCTHLVKSEARGLCVTGTTDWTDYTIRARLKIHLADGGGLVARYQGMERYIALVKTGEKLQLVMRHYGDSVLAEMKCLWKVDQFHDLSLTCKGKRITATLDGKEVLEATDDTLSRGGAGLLFDHGIVGFRNFQIG